MNATENESLSCYLLTGYFWYSKGGYMFLGDDDSGDVVFFGFKCD